MIQKYKKSLFNTSNTFYRRLSLKNSGNNLSLQKHSFLIEHFKNKVTFSFFIIYNYSQKIVDYIVLKKTNIMHVPTSREFIVKIGRVDVFEIVHYVYCSADFSFFWVFA